MLSILALTEGRLERDGGQGGDEQQRGGRVIPQNCGGAGFWKETGGASYKSELMLQLGCNIEVVLDAFCSFS